MLYINDYFLLIFALIVSIIISLLFILISYQKIFLKTLDKEKKAAYECGFTPFVENNKLFKIEFYRIAILFVIFDIEICFLFPLFHQFILHMIINFNNFIFPLFIFFLFIFLTFFYEFFFNILDF